jgi:hypothetical protein
MRIIVISDPGSGVFYYRFKIFLRDWEVRKKAQWVLLDRVTALDLDRKKPDIIFISQLFGDSDKLIKAAHDKGVAIYYDLDDYPFSLTDFHFYDGLELVLSQQVQPCLFHSDLVTVSTPYLYDALVDYYILNLGVKRQDIQERWRDRVYIRYNYVDERDFYFGNVGEANDNGKVVKIGYAAAPYHLPDLLIVLDALIELDKKYNLELHLYGFDVKFYDWESFFSLWLDKLGIVGDWREINLDEVADKYVYYVISVMRKLDQLKRVIAHPWVPITDHFFKLSRLKWDIGIAPLRDNIFNRCKTALKFYEYAMTGIPTLASNIPPYAGECNYLADNNFEDWYNKLEKLIVDREFRKEVARTQKEWVLENRTFSEKISDDLYEKLCEAVEKRKSIYEREKQRKVESDAI